MGAPAGRFCHGNTLGAVWVEHARPILLMCRNYCRLLEGSSMLDPYNEHHPETAYAPGGNTEIETSENQYCTLTLMSRQRHLIFLPCLYASSH